MQKLQQEMLKADGQKKKEIEEALKKFEKEREEMERLSEEMIYRRFYNSLYIALKDYSEKVDEDLI